MRKHFSFFIRQRNLILYGITYVWFEMCSQKAHIGVRIIFTDTAITFNFENTVFLFLFQLQWERRGRRKVNQSFPLTERSFRLWLLWEMFLSFSDTIAMIYSIVMTAPHVLPSANFICSYCDNTAVISTIGSFFLKQANTDQYQTLHHSGWEENERPLLPC